jgi:RNA polymerase sigma-70 factor, ECF subfamily
MPDPLPAESAPTLFVELLRETQRPLYGFVRGLVGDDEQARDVVQDVYVDAWRAARRAAPPFGHGGDAPALRRWLFFVAYRTAASVVRHRRIIAWESLDTRDPSETDRFYEPTAFEDQVAEGDALQTILNSMSPQDVACLLLNIVQGFTSAEIAQIVDIAPEAAKKRLARAKQRLRAAYFAQEARIGAKLEVKREERRAP